MKIAAPRIPKILNPNDKTKNPTNLLLAPLKPESRKDILRKNPYSADTHKVSFPFEANRPSIRATTAQNNRFNHEPLRNECVLRKPQIIPTAIEIQRSFIYGL